LFRIVCNVRSKPINGTPVVAIGTKYDLGCCHSRLERLENFGKGGMEQLAAEFAKVNIIRMLFVGLT